MPAESKVDGEHWAVKETFPVQSPIGPGPHEPSRQHLGEFYQVSEWGGKECELASSEENSRTIMMTVGNKRKSR